MNLSTSNTNHAFVVQVMHIEGGRRLREQKPNDFGYYTTPLAVLGGDTRSEIEYNRQSFEYAICDPSSRFNILLREGNLYGEYGHPYTKDVERIVEISEQKHSHHFLKVYPGETLSNGSTILMGEVKPFGPYGQYLKESFEDPFINTAFSLRSLCEQKLDPRTGKITRYIKFLVTFDFVYAPGYKQASKRYNSSMESMGTNNKISWNIPAPELIFDVKREDFFKDDGITIAYESITDKDILNIFGAKEITVETQTMGIRFPESPTLIGNDGNKHSLLHNVFMQK